MWRVSWPGSCASRTCSRATAARSSRYGGEEFALIPGQTDLEGAVGLAEKIRVAVAGSVVVLEGQERPTEASVTVSIGVAQYFGDPRALFNDADRALYRAKGSGKDCVVVEPAD